MLKRIASLLSFLFFLSVSAQQKTASSFWEKYQQNIEYDLFSRLYLPTEPGNLNLDSTLNNTIDVAIAKDFTAHDLKLLKQELTSQFKTKLNLSTEQFKTLSPYEAIYKSAELTTKIFTFTKVDDLQEYRNKSLLELIKLGKGECTRYVSVSALAFLVLKEHHPNLRPYHLLPTWPLENNAIKHAFNTLVVLGNDRIHVSYLDPTSFGNGGNLAVLDDTFFSTHGDFFKFQTYSLLSDTPGVLFFGESLMKESAPHETYLYATMLEALTASIKSINDENHKETADNIYSNVLGFDLDNPEPSLPKDFQTYGDKMLFYLYFYYYSLETVFAKPTAGYSPSVTKPARWLRQYFPSSTYVEFLIDP